MTFRPWPVGLPAPAHRGPQTITSGAGPGESAGTQRQHRSRLVGVSPSRWDSQRTRVVKTQQFAQPRIQVIEHVGVGVFGQPEEARAQLAARRSV